LEPLQVAKLPVPVIDTKPSPPILTWMLAEAPNAALLKVMGISMHRQIIKKFLQVIVFSATNVAPIDIVHD